MHYKFINMFKRLIATLVSISMLLACTPTRQIALDYPSNQVGESNSAQSIESISFEPISGFKGIDGDDYYMRLISEFDFKGENVLKSGCNNLSPSYENGDLFSSLIFSVRNDALKYKNDVTGFLYQSSTGKCNFKFEAKKTALMPWVRLDYGKETAIEYNFNSSANHEVNMAGLAGDVTAASSLLALTGVGVGVAAVGQIAGQWAKTTAQTSPAPKTSAKQSSESHSLPNLVSFSGNTGALKKAKFKVYSVAEGGVNVLGAETQVLGELKVSPELSASLLLNTNSDGIPDARDLNLSEIGYLPSKMVDGDTKLVQLLEQTKATDKPNLNPDWANFSDVESNCKKVKIILRDLGFNKFDRNAFLYYFLLNSPDWRNYNSTSEQLLSDDVSSKTMETIKAKSFGSCLVSDDYIVMKAMGLHVNSQLDWQEFQVSGNKKSKLLLPLRSIERQFARILTNSNTVEVEQQLYPLLFTTAKGDGTVLLQNYLGNFGLEKLLADPKNQTNVEPSSLAVSTAAADGYGVNVVTVPLQVSKPTVPDPMVTETISVAQIPAEGIVITARQLAQVISGLLFNEFSCARLLSDQQGQFNTNDGIVLFTTKQGSPRLKGGAIEFEFSAGKIVRIAFQLPTYKDFEQSVIDHPVMGDCKIDTSFINQLH